MKKMAVLLLLVGLLSVCANPKKEEIARLSDEVIDLHDEVMPLMDNLYKTRVDLQKIANADSTQSGQDRVDELIQELKLAEDAMMDWMRNFDPFYKGTTDDETIVYLMEKKESITQVAEQMNQALATGKERLERQ